MPRGESLTVIQIAHGYFFFQIIRSSDDTHQQLLYFPVRIQLPVCLSSKCTRITHRRGVPTAILQAVKSNVKQVTQLSENRSDSFVQKSVDHHFMLHSCLQNIQFIPFVKERGRRWRTFFLHCCGSSCGSLSRLGIVLSIIR